MYCLRTDGIFLEWLLCVNRISHYAFVPKSDMTWDYCDKNLFLFQITSGIYPLLRHWLKTHILTECSEGTAETELLPSNCAMTCTKSRVEFLIKWNEGFNVLKLERQIPQYKINIVIYTEQWGGLQQNLIVCDEAWVTVKPFWHLRERM